MLISALYSHTASLVRIIQLFMNGDAFVPRFQKLQLLRKIECIRTFPKKASRHLRIFPNYLSSTALF